MTTLPRLSGGRGDPRPPRSLEYQWATSPPPPPQLVACGCGSGLIKSWVRRKLLHPVHHGVYAVGAPPATPLERAAAAVLACGERALLSHDHALALWELRRRGWPAGHPEVTVAGDRRHPHIQVHRGTTLRRSDVRRRHGVPVTSPARTLLECATRLSEPVLRRAVNDALRGPDCSIADIRTVLWRCGGHQGRAKLARFADLSGCPTRSEFEDTFVAFCRDFGHPSPLVNTRVGGYEVDAYFPAERLIVELDGWDFHRNRRAFERDRERDADAPAAGIGTVRITWQRLTERSAAEAQRLGRIRSGRRV